MTVTVPLTGLLAKADDQADDLGIVIVYPEQIRALCEALRIAVEALAAVRERSDDPVACATALEGEWAVRELVDLGEKP